MYDYTLCDNISETLTHWKISVGRVRIKTYETDKNASSNGNWKAVIPQGGLKTDKKMLRQTASKSTAVSCHWIRSRSRSQFLWVVGNKNKFNEQGVVPVNYTSNQILIGEIQVMIELTIVQKPIFLR